MTSRGINGFEEQDTHSRDRRKNLASQLRVYDLKSRINLLESKSQSSVSTRFSLIVDASVLCSSNLPNVKAWLEERAATILVPKVTLEVLDQRKNGYLPLNLNARNAISYIEWVRSNNRAEHPNPGKLIIQHNDESTPWKVCRDHLIELPSIEDINLVNNAALKETELAVQEGNTSCPTNVRPIIRCALWRKSKEESRDWWVVSENNEVNIWCKAYGIKCLSPAGVEQEYRQRIRLRRARTTTGEANINEPARGMSTDIPSRRESEKVVFPNKSFENRGNTATSLQSVPATPVAPVAPVAPSAPSAPTPPLGNNIWSNSNSGWNDNMAIHSGFFQAPPTFGFPPMPPTHMMNHTYSGFANPGPPAPTNYPVPFSGMDYSMGPWDPYDPYQQSSYNYDSYNHGNHNDAVATFSAPEANDLHFGLGEEPNVSAGVPGQAADSNDFSHFDSFDFLEEGDDVKSVPAPVTDISTVEQQLREVLHIGEKTSMDTSNSKQATPVKASNRDSSKNSPAPTTPARKTHNRSEPRSSHKKRNHSKRPIDPDFVKRGKGVLWTPT